MTEQIRRNQDLIQKCDGIVKECDRIRDQKQRTDEVNEVIQHEISALKLAYLHVFPFSLYRSIRPDLSAMDDVDLAYHFFWHGINEGWSMEEFMR
jgi:hypothetical protein